MNRIAVRALSVLVLVAFMIGGMLFFYSEYITDGKNWVMAPGSQHVYENGTKLSGGVIVDRNGTFLMDLAGNKTYSEAPAIRRATVHWVGDRLGNISTPVLTEYAERMVPFDPVNGVYTYSDAAGVMELTLDAQVQAAALQAMGSYSGTVAVYNYKTGAILCAVSTPTFDPENVPDIEADTTGQYEGAYMNRFLQSVYIPGSIFKVVTLAAALECIPNVEAQEFTCEQVYETGDGEITCLRAHGSQSLKQIFSNSCNCSFAQLANQIGPERYQQYLERFSVLESVSFDGITTAEGNAELTDVTLEEMGWTGVGQFKDQINPCSYMVFLGAIANGGAGAEPYVVERITVDGKTTYQAESKTRQRILSEETAEILQEYLRNNVLVTYGEENFPGMTVCAKTGTAEVGGGKRPNATFTGFVADEEYPLAFIVTVEDGGYGRDVCIPILQKVLDACKDTIDSQ